MTLIRNKQNFPLIDSPYSLFKKERLDSVEDLASHEAWDVFVSAYNEELRIHKVFDAVPAAEKFLFCLPDYQLDKDTLPEMVLSLHGETETQIVEEALAETNLKSSSRICIDATGIVRQYLPVFMHRLKLRGISTFDFLYSEPLRYGDKESTEFSSAELIEVRQVLGYEGTHSTDTSRDLLIVGAGYEHRLVSAVSDHKSHADKRVIFAFPSMRADMYQESVLSTFASRESLGTTAVEVPRFAPAYDPFVTAATIADMVDAAESGAKGLTNLYLAPVSSKPMTIGFALYFLLERAGTPTSLILPFTRSYANRTADGISRVWIYRIELDT